MWDWELLKKGSGQFHYQIIGQYGNEDFQYTHVISYGSEEDEFYLHNHSMYELVYCIRGDAVYQVDGVRYVVEPNSLLVINPTAPHRMFICSSSPLERLFSISIMLETHLHCRALLENCLIIQMAKGLAVCTFRHKKLKK